ncbi:MAG: 23S rRNA (adenine(2503)-C(2))-methyltransferase RlmN [Caldithrix sp.]|nr:23S rRNA (adenine(2503)-C(2))-methyltransferase RlmN [Caldithrix sp.]
MISNPNYLLDYSKEELFQLMPELNLPSYRAAQLYNGIYVKRWSDFSTFSTLPKSLRYTFQQKFRLQTLTEVDRIRSPHDGTTKFLWNLQDGKQIESVIIYEKQRVTFCISSQVGCPLDCKFCATGNMGLLRNLSSGEILEQVIKMTSYAEKEPTNIVFMGMGEPLLNYDNVIKAAHAMIDPGGLCFSHKKITLSTSGLIKNIYRLSDEQQPFSFAISLNATDQQTRQQIMPVSRKYPLNALMEAARYYTQKTGKRITFEYVLIDGLNASKADAKRLIKLTHSIPCKINIIPCNSDLPQYQPPDESTIEEFDRLVNHKQRTITIRNRKGWEIKAACGQLYASHHKTSNTKVKTFETIDL